MAYRSFLPELWRGGQGDFTRELTRLQRNIDRMFQDFVSPQGGREEPVFMPPVDIEESDNQYVLNFDLPGIKPEDVKVEVEGDQLMVSGERKHERKSEEGKRYSYERSYGTFSRIFTLPQNVDPDQVKANFENGELQVVIPKSERAAGAKRIEVQAGTRAKKGEKAA